VAKYADLFRTGNKEIWDDGKMQNADTQESGDDRFALLFVDDEVNVLNSLRRIFMEENYEIHVAASAKEALALMESSPVHLIISDHRMTEMSGAELLREIKERWPQTIRIMLTGQADISAIMVRSMRAPFISLSPSRGTMTTCA